MGSSLSRGDQDAGARCPQPLRSWQGPATVPAAGYWPDRGPRVLPPSRPRTLAWSPARTYVLRAAAEGPATCRMVGRKPVAETTGGHME